jgi:hypothetical protein
MFSSSAQPAPQGLYDGQSEHDACGVGFVANIKGRASHGLVQQALLILQNLDHRGAVGADEPAAGWTVLMAGVRGMPLGLHGAIGPLPLAPYGEIVHLPAVLVDDHARMAAQRYGGLVTPADLGATLIELVGGTRPGGGDPREGRSLVPLLDEWQLAPRDRAIAVTNLGVAIATPAWHLVLPTEDAAVALPPVLYAKPDDYFEACDVADRGSDVAEELARLAGLAASEPLAAWTAPLSAAAPAGT